jgi:hypothetical protein
MKYLKSFEKSKNIQKPKIGDYIIVYLDAETSPNMESFTNNKIGKVIEKENKSKHLDKIFVEYEQIPPVNSIKYFDLDTKTNKYYMWFTSKAPIKYISSKNIEDLETIINAYENTNEDKHNQPQIGDYVILTDKYHKLRPTEVNNFINTHIGLIGKILKYSDIYIIDFDNPPKINAAYDFALQYGCSARKDEIKYHSKNKEDLEIFINININKFNL